MVLATAARYLFLALFIAMSMILLHRALCRAGAREATASGYAFILPWLLGVTLLWALPAVWSLVLGFTRYGVLSTPEWIGFGHYARILLHDEVFRIAAWNTISFACLSVGLGMTASLGAALLLSLPGRFMGFWRLLYYLPSVVPAVSTALLWRWIFVPEGGLANAILASLGLPQPGWFADPHWVIPAFVIMSLQGAAGNNMVIFLARLRGVDPYLHEAAALDGAGLIARFRHVTLPQVSPVIFFHLVMGIIAALQVFTQPMFVETPGRSGLFYAVYVYRTGWHELRMGYACALSWVLFAALLALTAVIFRSARYWVSYEETDTYVPSRSEVMRPGPLRRAVWFALVAALGVAMIVPVAWMVGTSLKPAGDLMQTPPQLLSWPPQWSNYLDAWRALPFTRFLGNTLFIVVLAVSAEVLTSLLAAYGFARFQFPGRRILFGVLLSTMLIPGAVLMIPVFLIWRSLGLVGQFDPLILPSLFGGGALFVFLAHQFLKTLPRETEEAARIDGATPARIFFSIILPQARPVLFVIALISFQTHWNDFLGPLLYLNDIDRYTMTLGLHFFQGSFMGEAPKWNWMMAMTTLMALPTVVLFLITQRSFFPKEPHGKR